MGFQSLRALGYVVDEHGLHTDPQKVEAIMAIKQPVDSTGIKSFLGMVGFYGALIPGYSKLAGPLHGLTTKGRNVVKDWGEEHTRTALRL